jgi:hypothetical protein
VQVEALLCDAATVRENLLHVLGGGITRIYRQFPATLGLDLALVLTFTQSEAQEKHRLRVLVQTADGAKLAEAIAEIVVTPSLDLKPGERMTVSVALSLRQVPIPAEGIYGVEVLIGGLLQRSFTFVAAPPPTPHVPVKPS